MAVAMEDFPPLVPEARVKKTAPNNAAGGRITFPRRGYRSPNRAKRLGQRGGSNGGFSPPGPGSEGRENPSEQHRE